MQHGVHLSTVRGEIRMNKENILEIDNLERSYSTVMPDGEAKVYSVLRGISFQVKRGEFIGKFRMWKNHTFENYRNA